MALESFIEAKDAITKYGSYENVCFDLVINRTIESLGTWQDFCISPNDHWKRKEFIKNYCMYYREYQAGELEQKSRYLAGINNNPDKRINYINTKHAVPTHKQIDELVKPVNVLKELGKKIEGKKVFFKVEQRTITSVDIKDTNGNLVKQFEAGERGYISEKDIERGLVKTKEVPEGILTYRERTATPGQAIIELFE